MNLIRLFKDFFRGHQNLDLLIKRGLELGQNVNIEKGVVIEPSMPWLVRIGNNVTLGPQVYILAHDASTKIPMGVTKVGRVTIGNNVFIGARAIILPNVSIGDNVVIGAGSIVSKDIESNSVVVGNPARKISTLDEYVQKNKEIYEIVGKSSQEEIKYENHFNKHKSRLRFVD